MMETFMSLDPRRILIRVAPKRTVRMTEVTKTNGVNQEKKPIFINY